LKLIRTYQILVYTDDVNILEGSVHTIKEKAEALIVFSKDIRLEVIADNSKYMVMSRDQNAGRSHNIKFYNISFESVEEFKYLGTTSTNQNSVPKEIKSRLKSGNGCYHSVQNILSSSLLPKNKKIKTYNNIILHVVWYGCET